MRENTTNNKPKIQDVARLAGVSIATVSHVMNGTKNVSQGTRDKVEAAIQELGYQPNVAARTLKSRQSRIIILIMPDITSFFFAEIIEVVENIMMRNGYLTIIMNTNENPEKEKQCLAAISNGLGDGVILASTLQSYREIKHYLTIDIPMVLIDRAVEGSYCDTMLVDNHKAMYDGVTHLINLGKRRIGYLAANLALSTTRERLEAYEEAMQHAGLSTDGLVLEGNSMRTCVHENLQKVLKQNIDALVVANNVMSNEAMLRLLAQGIRAGFDLEMLGYKESNISQYGLQHMSLIVQPTTELARLTANRLLERIKHPDLPPMQTVIQASFVPHVEGE